MEKSSTQYKREHKKDFGNEKIEILFEDQYIIIINKPSGLLSVPYAGSHARTALDALEALMRKNGTYSANHKPHIVHRLDRDTSGVMMFAMTENAQKKIMDTWHTMVTERLYRAVAENPADAAGILPDSGLIDDALAYNAHNVGFVPKNTDKPAENAHRSKNRAEEKSIYEKHLDFSHGEAQFKTVPARTHYKIVERGQTHTMFELSLDTGKKNQIRAHLASKGYPLAGDENYRAKTDPFERLALHARTLEFNHPFTGKHLKFEVPEPAEWLEFVKSNTQKSPLRTPAWFEKSPARESYKKDSGHEKYEKPQKRLSRKDFAGKDFIARGKMKRR